VVAVVAVVGWLVELVLVPQLALAQVQVQVQDVDPWWEVAAPVLLLLVLLLLLVVVVCLYRRMSVWDVMVVDLLRRLSKMKKK
jgi:hypothetical protein